MAEAIIFIGIQATGKTTFYRQKFFDTHLRISLDMLKTRHRENVFLNACLETRQRFVVDNTNPTVEERKRYILKAKDTDFKVIGYYFESKPNQAIDRNDTRPENRQIPIKGIYATYAKLELPSWEEGFDRLYYVSIDPNSSFHVEEWHVEIR